MPSTGGVERHGFLAGIDRNAVNCVPLDKAFGESLLLITFLDLFVPDLCQDQQQQPNVWIAKCIWDRGLVTAVGEKKGCRER